MNRKRFDRVMTSKGKQQRSNSRYNYDLLRIGHFDEPSHDFDDEIGWGHANFTKQLSNRVGNQRPPLLPRLGSLQRAQNIEC